MKNRLLTLFAFILISVLSVYAQGGHTVSGVVLTEQGEPLVGVTIHIRMIRQKVLLPTWTVILYCRMYQLIRPLSLVISVLKTIPYW